MISEKIKELRRKSKISQEVMAEKIGVSRQAITKWETGAGIPDIENLKSIAKLFQISIDELIGNESNISNESKYMYESSIEYDIDEEKNYDILFMGANTVLMKSYEGEKLKINLNSNTIENIQSVFKVKLEDNKKRLDVKINRNNDLSESRAKEELVICIEIPQQYSRKIELEGNVEKLNLLELSNENIEFSGKVKVVDIRNVNSHVEISSNDDINAKINNTKGYVDFNQISAPSKLFINNNQNKTMYKAKGITNHIIFENVETNEDDEKNSDLIIELNGFKSELVVRR